MAKKKAESTPEQQREKLNKSIEFLNYRIGIMSQQVDRMIAPAKNLIKKVGNYGDQQDILVKSLAAVNKNFQGVRKDLVVPLRDLGVGIANLAEFYEARVQAGLHENSIELRRTARRLQLIGVDYSKSLPLLADLTQILGMSTDKSVAYIKEITAAGISYGTHTGLLIDALNSFKDVMISASVAFGAQKGANIGKVMATLTALLPRQADAIHELGSKLLAGTAQSQIALMKLGAAQYAELIKSSDPNQQVEGVKGIVAAIQRISEAAGGGPSRAIILDRMEEVFDISRPMFNLADVLSTKLDDLGMTFEEALLERQANEAMRASFEESLQRLYANIQPLVLPLLDTAASILGVMGDLLNSNYSFTAWMVGGGLVGMITANRLVMIAFWQKHMMDLRAEFTFRIREVIANMRAMHKYSNAARAAEVVRRRASMIQRQVDDKNKIKALISIVRNTFLASKQGLMTGGVIGIIVGLLSHFVASYFLDNTKSKELQQEQVQLARETLNLQKKKSQGTVNSAMSRDIAMSITLLKDIYAGIERTADGVDRTADGVENIPTSLAEPAMVHVGGNF